MAYSCSDFTDDIIEALGIDLPDDALHDPSIQADLAMANIDEMHFALSRCYDDAGISPATKALVAKALNGGRDAN